MKIAVVGGSLGGLFAGVLLHRAGFDVTVFERSHSGFAGRGAGLVGQREIFAILREVGCEHVAQMGVVAKERITLDRAGNVLERHATPQSQLSWDRIYAAFRERLPDNRYVMGRAVTAVDNTPVGVKVTFEDGSTEGADLLIGADGVGSVVRGAVTSEVPSYAGYAAWRGLYAEAALAKEAASLLFERFAFFHYERSQILGYLVAGADGSLEPGQRRYNWVWYRSTPAGGALTSALTDKDGTTHRYSLPPGAMSEADVAALRVAAAADLPPAFADAVEAEPQPFVQAVFDHVSPVMVKDRVALLGDAAFVVRPHTAMGVAKAAGDALSLVKSLRQTTDPNSALYLYDAERRSNAIAIAAHGRRLGASLE